ncbi:hypothetical protein AB6A40_006386 [Gnathostoma spinigerum]|uniref:Uncharacterized protein n=1 Tax=Gnathostoma spinigerum TaxID=75299 RepID=A0ABD6EKF6_9BILA
MSAFPLMCNVEHTRQHRAAIERQSPVKMFIGRILNDDVAELITVAEDSNTEVINAPSIPTASPPISPNLSPAIITPAHHAHKVHHMIDMTAVSRCFYQAETFFSAAIIDASDAVSEIFNGNSP